MAITDLLQELTVLTERLGKLNEDLARKIQARNEYDAVIGETEAAYMKVGSNSCENSTAAPRNR